MSVSLYFGLPGSGKTTYASFLAVREQKRIERHKSRYDYVYSNFPIAYNGILQLNTNDIGQYNIHDALIIIDEATLMADSRDYKAFTYNMKSFFLLHRHFKVDIYLFTQQWDGVDKKIRVITDRCFYIHKGVLRRWVSYCQRIPYGIIIPDKKDLDSKSLGEIIQGYCKPSFIIRLLSPRIKRKRYYKYFDSFEVPELPEYQRKEWYHNDVKEENCLLSKIKCIWSNTRSRISKIFRLHPRTSRLHNRNTDGSDDKD